MTGRKSHVQNLMELIDKRVRTILKNSGTETSSDVISSGTRTSPSPFENVSFITRDDHRGHGHGDLPNSKPLFDLDGNIIPSVDKTCDLGSRERAWRNVFVDKITTISDDISFGIDCEFLTNKVAFKDHAGGVLIYGYGNHRVRDVNGVRLYPNTASIQIARPIPYSTDRAVFGIGSWRVNPWYSREEISGEHGTGSRRNCASNASPLNPGVEAEIVDTGNPECVYVLFRNFLSYPVYVGVSVSY